MPETPLPLDRFTAGTHIEALEGLVDRYEHEQKPIHYKKASTDISDSTLSSCLRFFNEIGLINAKKQGIYIPSSEIIDFFTKIGESRINAVREIRSTLDEYTLFNEVTFHGKDNGIQIEELAEKTAGTLDLKKDKVSNVQKAIQIFEELEAIEIDEENVVTLKEKIEVEADNDDSDSVNEEKEEKLPDEDGRINPSEVSPEALELPPIKGDPESLLELCKVLKAGGVWESDEISEKIDSSPRTIRGNARYGSELGFVEISEKGYLPTQRGYDLGFEKGLNEKTERIFLNGVLESKIYISLLNRCINNIDGSDDKLTIKSSQCERILRTTFDFTEENEDTLKGTINVFFKTIEASGYGNYVVGRGGLETRIEFSENELDDLRNKIQNGVRSSTKEDKQEETEEDGDTEQDSDNQDESVESDNDGPPLQISSVTIQNFRNVKDSGNIRLEPITTFIGKNESGKTSTLEAIYSFSESGEYPDRDICNDIDYDSKSNVPIITLTFKITKSVATDHYMFEEINGDFPIEYQITKYADGHVEDVTGLDITTPDPEFVYYNEYDLISDTLYFDEDSNKKNSTFRNLLRIGDLTEEDVIETSGLEHDQAIENAENKIEDRLNSGWSQKDIKIKLSYDSVDNCLRVYIQDEIEDEERDLTHPSQRSEGFQWFFSFYVNMLAEVTEDSDGSKILLLDDPAVNLHPSGKQDWLDSLEEIAEEEQVIYTSHSPYLISKQYPSRIRTVEDSPEGTKINADIFDADTGTLEPLRNALGIDLSASPFVSEGQLLVEGPSEYYILSAVGTYMDKVLDRDFIDWSKISLMPVRGADDTIGKASWLESETLEYLILLDSDDQGQAVAERIETHQGHIDDDRVQLLQRRPYNEDVVIEDIFDPVLYLEATNEYYSESNEEFEPISIEQTDPNKWEIGRQEYDGQRIDKILENELERQDIAEHLENDDGEIDLAKRPIAERLSEKINSGNIEPEDLDYFNEVLGNVNSNLDV